MVLSRISNNCAKVDKNVQKIWKSYRKGHHWNVGSH